MRKTTNKNSSKRVVSREKKKLRIRRKIEGTSERPRLSIFRSSKHIYAQLIDDTKRLTLVSASSLQMGGELNNNKDSAAKVGAAIAKEAVKLKIEQVVFDRNGYLYHGRVKSLADAARENGLKF